MNATRALKLASNLIAKGWASEALWCGWCAKRVDGKLDIASAITSDDIELFSVTGALVRTTGERWPFEGTLVADCLDRLEHESSPLWPERDLPLHMWLREPHRTVDEVLRVFDRAIQRSKRS